MADELAVEHLHSPGNFSSQFDSQLKQQQSFSKPAAEMVETLKRKADGEDNSGEDGVKPVRARRASKPKVKTGCNNCKYVKASGL